MASFEGGGRHREPAWHRRDRRRRSGHRLLAQVSAACAKLASHHGSAPPEILRPLLDALSKYAPRPDDVPWPYALVSIGSHRSPKTVLMPLNSIDIPVVAVASVVASSISSLGRNLIGSEWRPLPSKPSSSSCSLDIPVVAVAPVVVSTSTSSPSLVRGSMAGDSQFLDIPEVAVVSTVASTFSTSVTTLAGGEWRPLPFNSSSSSSGGDFRSLPHDYWRMFHLRFSDASRAEAAEFLSDLNACVGEFRLRAFTQQKVFHKIWLSSIGLVNTPENPSVCRLNTCLDKCFELLRATLSLCASFESYRYVFRDEFLAAYRTFPVLLNSLTDEVAAATTAFMEQVA
jgi:hypothetical protein